MNKKIIRYIDESIKTKEKLKDQASLIVKAADLIVKSIKEGGKLILFGNGGSAADAQHIAAEFVGKFKQKRKGLPAISLTTNTSTLTAISNDFSYEHVFSRQLESIGKKGDVAIAISTSGKSRNVIEAVKLAKKIQIVTIGMTGKKGNDLSKKVDLAINVPSDDTQHIQESHILIGHILVDLVESKLNKYVIKK